MFKNLPCLNNSFDGNAVKKLDALSKIARIATKENADREIEILREHREAYFAERLRISRTIETLEIFQDSEDLQQIAKLKRKLQELSISIADNAFLINNWYEFSKTCVNCGYRADSIANKLLKENIKEVELPFCRSCTPFIPIYKKKYDPNEDKWEYSFYTVNWVFKQTIFFYDKTLREAYKEWRGATFKALVTHMLPDKSKTEIANKVYGKVKFTQPELESLAGLVGDTGIVFKKEVAYLESSKLIELFDNLPELPKKTLLEGIGEVYGITLTPFKLTTKSMILIGSYSDYEDKVGEIEKLFKNFKINLV